MPWTGDSFHKHNKGLSTAQSAHAARIANAVLRRSGDEGMAIATANKMARREDGGGLLTGEPPDPATANFASGGMTAEPGSVAPNLTRSGLLHSPVPGRTDHIAAKPAAGSYVIPADVTSGVGEGNTLAGGRALQAALGIGPFGTPLSNPRAGAGARSRFARMPSVPALPRVYKDGGHTDKRDGVECLLAGGEFVVSPEDVMRIGDGNMKRGHRILDQLVVHLRKQIIGQMKKLPPPVGSKT